MNKLLIYIILVLCLINNKSFYAQGNANISFLTIENNYVYYGFYDINQNEIYSIDTSLVLHEFFNYKGHKVCVSPDIKVGFDGGKDSINKFLNKLIQEFPYKSVAIEFIYCSIIVDENGDLLNVFYNGMPAEDMLIHKYALDNIAKFENFLPATVNSSPVCSIYNFPVFAINIKTSKEIIR